MTNKKVQTIIKELFIRCRKLNISLVFITHYYFRVPEDVTLNSIYYLIMNIHNRRELKQIAIDNSADIDYKDFLKIFKNCTRGHYSSLAFDSTLPADIFMRFRNHFSDSPL